MEKIIYFSASEHGFYDPDIHTDSIPNDAVRIDASRHAELLAAQAEGQMIVGDSEGFPIAIDPPAPTERDIADAARAKRDALLKASDWVALRAMETGEPVPPDWAAYRQALRDVPEQEGFPVDIDWPIPPSANEG